jgi:hypothetical protein
MVAVGVSVGVAVLVGDKEGVTVPKTLHGQNMMLPPTAVEVTQVLPVPDAMAEYPLAFNPTL